MYRCPKIQMYSKCAQNPESSASPAELASELFIIEMANTFTRKLGNHKWTSTMWDRLNLQNNTKNDIPGNGGSGNSFLITGRGSDNGDGLGGVGGAGGGVGVGTGEGVFTTVAIGGIITVLGTTCNMLPIWTTLVCVCAPSPIVIICNVQMLST